MKVFSEDPIHVNAECDNCGKVLKIKRVHLTRTDDGYAINPYIKCFCGSVHHQIVGHDEIHQPAPQATKPDDSVKCPKCKSGQVLADRKGYSATKGILGLLLIPGGIFWGFSGSRKVEITCLKCGYKWQAGKK